jgi:hypothetical protein
MSKFDKHHAKHHKHKGHVTSLEFLLVMFVLVMIIAALALITGYKQPYVWAFLTAAIGVILKLYTN